MIKTLYPQFQRWSAHGSIYIVSDTHFNDPDRAFMGYKISELEQNRNLRRCIYPNDTLIHLGDVGNPEWLKNIKCYKVLIMGNHDQSASKFKEYFDEIYTGPLWIAEKLVLSHEPLTICARATGNPIAFNIHGHDHGGRECDDGYHLNITQNLYGYKPLNLGEFIKSGALKQVNSIHREIINNAIKKEG